MRKMLNPGLKPNLDFTKKANDQVRGKTNTASNQNGWLSPFIFTPLPSLDQRWACMRKSSVKYLPPPHPQKRGSAVIIS